MNRLLVGSSDKLDLLLHFIGQDIPHGVTVIDTDGDLAMRLADTLPEGYEHRTHYFDPSDNENIANFNVLQNVKDKTRLVDDLIVFFDLMFPGGETTLTRLYSNTALRAILTILLDNEAVSLSSVLEFLSDEKFQRTCIDNCKNTHAIRMWNRTAGWDKSFRNSAFALIEAKLDNILISPLLNRTLDKGHGFYLSKTRIFIANLSRQKLGDSAAKLLATLFILRAQTPIYVSDFGFVASDYLASLFPKGGYTVALNFLSELPRNVQQSVLGFEEKYVFTSTPEDAKRLHHYVGQDNPKNLIYLSPKEFLPKLQLDPPFTTGRFDIVRKRSIARHTRPATLPQKEPSKGEGW